jgi:DNA-binding MarR family transcriptional regulator
MHKYAIEVGVDRRCSEVHREDIAEALEQGAALVVRHMADRQGFGLTYVAVLSKLGREGPVRATVLATEAGVSQPAITQLIQRLERQGLANRVSDPDDGRAALVSITDEGRTLLADLRRDRHGRVADLLATLSPEDETALALAMHVAMPIIQRLIHNATHRRA